LLSKPGCRQKGRNKNKLQLRKPGKKLRRLKLLDRKLFLKSRPELQLKMPNERQKRQKLLESKLKWKSRRE
jgi:hypothetical protein